MNSSMTDSDSCNCDESEIKFYISLGANCLLGILTLISEFMAHSKCKSNSISEIPIQILKQITKRDTKGNDSPI